MRNSRMKRLGVYLKPYTLQSILGPLFKLLEALLELFVPLVVADIIDTGIASGDSGYLLRRCLLLIGLGLLGLAASVTAQYFAAKAAIGFTAGVRHAVFQKVQSLSYAELDRLGTSTLMTRMTSDMNQVQTGLNLALRLLLRSPFVVFGAMIMAFTIDVKSAWVFAVIIPLLFRGGLCHHVQLHSALPARAGAAGRRARRGKGESCRCACDPRVRKRAAGSRRASRKRAGRCYPHSCLSARFRRF